MLKLYICIAQDGTVLEGLKRKKLKRVQLRKKRRQRDLGENVKEKNVMERKLRQERTVLKRAQSMMSLQFCIC